MRISDWSSDVCSSDLLDAEDQLTLEWAGTYRHYHAAMMRTLPIGRPQPLHREMHRVASDALLAVEDSLRPGKTFGEAFDAHTRVMDAAGYQAHRLNACGYSLGDRKSTRLNSSH